LILVFTFMKLRNVKIKKYKSYRPFFAICGEGTLFLLQYLQNSNCYSTFKVQQLRSKVAGQCKNTVFHKFMWLVCIRLNCGQNQFSISHLAPSRECMEVGPETLNFFEYFYTSMIKWYLWFYDKIHACVHNTHSKALIQKV
jgi:hypothetical protein